MSKGDFYPAPEAFQLVRRAIYDIAAHSALTNTRVECMFSRKPLTVDGKQVYARISIVKGKNAALAGRRCVPEEALPPLCDMEVSQIAREVELWRTGRMEAYLTEFNCNPFFLIEFDGLAWDRLTPPQKLYLVDHELCHAYVDGDKLRLLPHDLEEFGGCVVRHGIDIMPDIREFYNHCRAADLNGGQLQFELDFDDIYQPFPAKQPGRDDPDTPRRIENYLTPAHRALLREGEELLAEGERLYPRVDTDA